MTNIIKEVILLLIKAFSEKSTSTNKPKSIETKVEEVTKSIEKEKVKEPTNYLVSKEEILMGRDKLAPLDAEQKANLQRLLDAVQIIRLAYGKPLIVSSGYRPSTINVAVGGAKRSLHTSCLAVDFKDLDGKIDEWLNTDEGQNLLEKLNMWQEAPAHTPNWSHIDLGNRPVRNRPGLKKRQFNP